MKIFKTTSVVTLKDDRRQVCTYVQAKNKVDALRILHGHLHKNYPEALNIEIDPFFFDEIFIVKDQLAA